jgi:hypothetical protein
MILAAAGLWACNGGSEALQPAADEQAAVGDSAVQEAAPDGEKAAQEGSDKTFGQALSEREPVTLTSVYGKADEYLGQTVTIKSEIADVCQKAGCWAVLTEGDLAMRVTIPEHDWALPKDCAGQTGMFEGKIVKADTRKKTVEHFKGESMKPEVMPEVTQEVLLAMELTGARLLGS